MKSKNNTYNRNNQLARLPIQCCRFFSGNEYKFYDYLLYRNNNTKWQYYISDITQNLGVDKRTVLRLCKNGKERGFLLQDKFDHYHLNYSGLHDFIWSEIDKQVGDNLSSLGDTITPAGDNLSSLGDKNTPTEVTKIHHTSINKRIKKEERNKSIKNISNSKIYSNPNSDLTDNDYCDKLLHQIKNTSVFVSLSKDEKQSG